MSVERATLSGLWSVQYAKVELGFFRAIGWVGVSIDLLSQALQHTRDLKIQALLDSVVSNTNPAGLLERPVPKQKQFALHSIDAPLQFVVEKNEILINGLPKVMHGIKRRPRTRDVQRAAKKIEVDAEGVVYLQERRNTFLVPERELGALRGELMLKLSKLSRQGCLLRLQRPRVSMI